MTLLTPLAPAEPPAVRIENPEVVLRQGDSVNLTCRIAAEPPATGEWVLPDVGPELPLVTKARPSRRHRPPLQRPLAGGVAGAGTSRGGGLYGHPIPAFPAALGLGAGPGDQQRLLQPQPQRADVPGGERGRAGGGQRDAECHL